MEIGLFPLGLVLLPGERVPLHIFEPRYKELINECISSQSEFGIVLLNSRGTRDVGTKAEVVEVLERYDDGRLDVVVQGTMRFKLLKIRFERSFLTGVIAPFVDDVPLPGDAEYESCLEEYRRAMSAIGIDHDEPSPDYLGLAFHVASRFQMGIDIKQELLEMRSESARLSRLKELMEAAAASMRRQIVEKRAATNGEVDRMGRLGPA